MEYNIPENVQTVLSFLRGAGFRAVPVGGCVRDLMRGVTPHDWDIATSATPNEMLNVFADFRALRLGQAGAKHGTITVIMDHTPVEITTFRADGEYSDGRRPDSVSFSRELEDDLARRDFTINAMCLGEDGGIIDMFGGRQDLKNGVIRAIGDPNRRFQEDALRILRALRFAALFKFMIEENTAKSLLKHAKRLDMLASERVSSELIKLLCAPNCVQVMLKYSEVICTVIPELKPAIGLHQREDYHCYDVYEHIIRSVSFAPCEPVLRLAMLMHDVGKPFCADGEGHFYKHAAEGVKLSEKILKRLGLGKAMRDRILFLVKHHDLPIYPADSIKIKKLLSKYGEPALRQLLAVQKADVKAQRADIAVERSKQLQEVEQLLVSVLDEHPALTLSQLAVSGKDLMNIGVPQGPELGMLLNMLLSKVVTEQLPNKAEALLDYTKEYISLKRL